MALDTVSDPQLQKTLKEVEQELLDIITSSLRAKKMSLEESQKLAQDFLSLLPPQDKHDLLARLKKLSRVHPDAMGVYIDLAEEMNTEETNTKLHKMAEYIHTGNIEEALAVAKGGTK